jgi:hypothetical protein
LVACFKIREKSYLFSTSSSFSSWGEGEGAAAPTAWLALTEAVEQAIIFTVEGGGRVDAREETTIQRK